MLFGTAKKRLEQVAVEAVDMESQAAKSKSNEGQRPETPKTVIALDLVLICESV